MHFLSPIWFFALAALSIPVVIHLWNIKPGKTLKVGSIVLISEASKTNRRSLKLLDVLLFALRCLLLAIVAFLLATPVWNQAKPAEKVRGLVLVPKADFKQAYTRFKPKVDSLIRAGYQFHYFDNGFAQGNLTKLLADTTLKNSPSSVNYWNLAKQLERQVSSKLPVYVFTPNGINHFSGVKPVSQLNLKWQAYTQPDTVARWIAAAVFAPDNSIKVTIGNSSPAGIFYSSQMVNKEGNADVAISVESGQPVAKLKGPDSVAAVDTSTLKIAIYTDKYALDAGYLKAAITAAVNFSGRKAIVKQYVNLEQVPTGQSWLFWLADSPVDERLANGSRNIFSYEQGKVVSVKSWLDAGNGLINPGKKIMLTKMIIGNKGGESVWKNGFGTQILAKRYQKHAVFYHFYTHFNPLWTDLTWDETFPKMMLDLINGNPYQLPQKFDKRMLTDREIQPDKIDDATEIASVDQTEQTDLTRYFWLLLVVLFAAERLLSHSIQSVPANG